MMTKQDNGIASFVPRAESLKQDIAQDIAKQRDKLRELLDELEEIHATTGEAVDGIQQAIDALEQSSERLSEYL